MIYTAECLEWMKSQPDDSFDCTITSPPYEDSRDYGIGFKLKGEDWIEWAFERFVECLRITCGPVCWVVNGRTRQGRYSLVPEKLQIDLDEAGYIVQKACIFHRYGLPGKRLWFRDVYEPIVCASKSWPLPYLDNTAAGNEPKYERGGNFSNRKVNGQRVAGREYPQLDRTMAVNVFSGKVGKGHMGSDLAHDSEAPFPEWLVYPLLVTFCPPGGTVFDPFVGSGTTASVAIKHGRKFVGVDCRKDQAELAKRRIEEAHHRIA